MTSTGSNKNQKQNNLKGLFFWILIALLIRWQAVEPRWIPSGSMLPTLQIQEYETNNLQQTTTRKSRKYIQVKVNKSR